MYLLTSFSLWVQSHALSPAILPRTALLYTTRPPTTPISRLSLSSSSDGNGNLLRPRLLQNRVRSFTLTPVVEPAFVGARVECGLTGAQGAGGRGNAAGPGRFRFCRSGPWTFVRGQTLSLLLPHEDTWQARLAGV